MSGLVNCVGRVCREAVPKIPLTRIELRRVRKQEKEEKRQERREEREQREKERKEKEAKEKGKGQRETLAAGLLDDREDVAAGDRRALDDVQLLDLAGAVGGDLVLHLHRLDHADQVALGDLGALLDGDLEDRSLQRRGQRLAGGARAAARLALALRRAACAAPVAGGRGVPATASPITLTSKSLPPTSTL